MRKIFSVSVVAIALLLGGCSSEESANEENFTKAIQASLDGSTVFCYGNETYPYKVHPTNMSGERHYKTLVNAGLVVLVEKKNNFSRGTWDLTDLGRKHFRQGFGFCYGSPYVEKIISFHEPSKNVAIVKYVVGLEEEPELKAIGSILDSRVFYNLGEREKTLILTNKGWEVD